MDGGEIIGVRRAARFDIPRLVEIARRAYFDWPVDWTAVSVWLHGHIEHPDIFICLEDSAASIAVLSKWIQIIGAPSKTEALVPYIAGQVWGAARCLRATAAWAQARGAERLRVDAETGIDLGPLVKRLGRAFSETPSYSVRL